MSIIKTTVVQDNLRLILAALYTRDSDKAMDNQPMSRHTSASQSKGQLPGWRLSVLSYPDIANISSHDLVCHQLTVI